VINTSYQVKEIAVVNPKRKKAKIKYINELEFVGGYVYANIW